MEKITPCVDIAFKKIFGVDENKDLLIALINSIVSEKDQVVDLTLLNPYNLQNFSQEKLSILDIKAKGADGKRFNIEIQLMDDADYDKRALYYWAKLYTEQLKEGEHYSKLSKTIGIHILNFTSIPNVDKYHNVFHIAEKKSDILYFKDLELHTIELKKFANNEDEDLSQFVARIQSSLDMWVAFLTRHDLFNKEQLPPAVNNNNFKKALNVVDIMKFNTREREIYDGRLKWLLTKAGALKKKKAEGLAEGLAKGEAKGLAKGLAEGLAKGEAKSKIEMANNMLKLNLDHELIAKVTGLNLEEINQLYRHGKLV